MDFNEFYPTWVEIELKCQARNPKFWFWYAERHYQASHGAHVLLPLTQWGGYVVARGKSGKQTAAGTPTSWNTTFIDISLAGLSEDAIWSYFETEEQVYDAATALLESGYRIAFSYNSQNDAFICSVTCKDDESPNAGCTFTAFAGSWHEALIAALVKHLVVAKGVWRGASGKESRPRYG